MTLPWGPEVRGPYAVEQSLARTPIKPGEKRELKMFLSDLNKVCDITLTAKGPEEVPLIGRAKKSLLRVEQTTTLDGKPRPEFDMTLWVDSRGRGPENVERQPRRHGDLPDDQKGRPGAGTAGRTGPAPFDQITSSIIKVSPPIARPGASRLATYRVSLKDDDPAQVIPADRRQSLKPGGAKNTAILEVKTAGLDAGEAGPAEVEPEYLRPNAMIDSADARVVELAALPSATPPHPGRRSSGSRRGWPKTSRTRTSRSRSPPPARSRNLTGDCTEHGVLTAAMCRAAGVPARVVVGLVYAETLGGFGFHLWNEVHVNHRWVAVDAAYKQTEVDAVHIKLAESSLDGVAPFEALLARRPRARQDDDRAGRGPLKRQERLVCNQEVAGSIPVVSRGERFENGIAAASKRRWGLERAEGVMRWPTQ